MTGTALGWRVHSWWAVVVAVTGPVGAPVVVGRERVTLMDDESVQEPYHAAVGRPLDEATELIRSIEERAASAAEALIGDLASSMGPVAAVGVVGGGRRLTTDLTRILSKHALLHASERDLFEQAVMEGAARAGLRVSTLPATGQLFDDASRVLGIDAAPAIAALGKSIGPPWGKDHREATAAALVALHAVT